MCGKRGGFLLLERPVLMAADACSALGSTTAAFGAQRPQGLPPREVEAGFLVILPPLSVGADEGLSARINLLHQTDACRHSGHLLCPAGEKSAPPFPSFCSMILIVAGSSGFSMRM